MKFVVFARFLLAAGLAWICESPLHGQTSTNASTNKVQAVTNEFSPLERALERVLRTQDGELFAITAVATPDDWNSIFRTNLIRTSAAWRAAQEEAGALRRQTDRATQGFVDAGARLGGRFYDKIPHATALPPPPAGIFEYPYARPGMERLPHLDQLEFRITTDENPEQAYILALKNLVKFPAGWRVLDGLSWIKFPDGMLDAAGRRDLWLINKAADDAGFTSADDPTLLKPGSAIARLLHDRDFAAFKSNGMLTSEDAIAWAKQQRAKATPQQMTAIIEAQQQAAASHVNALFALLDTQGIDFHDSQITVKSARVGSCQTILPQKTQGMIAENYAVELGVASSAQAKTGVSISGSYTFEVSALTLISNEWKISGNLSLIGAPPGVLDAPAQSKVSRVAYMAAHDVLPPGAVIPDFKFTNLLEKKEGALSDFAGKITVLDVWTIAIPKSFKSTTVLEALSEDHPEWAARVAFLGLSLDLSPRTATQLTEYYGWTNLVSGWAGPGGLRSAPAQALEITSVPVIYIIGPDGKVITAGHLQESEIASRLSAVLKTQGAKP